VKFAIIIGPDEWKDGKVRIKDQRTSKEGGSEEKGELVDKEEMVNWLKEKLGDED
jgi:histidyl-tRNA synthetase